MMLSSQRNKIDKTGMTEHVKSDLRGLYSLLMPNECCPSTDPVDLECIFGQAGEVRGINITSRYTFVRYATSQEADKAIKMFAKEYKMQVPRSSNKATNGHKKEGFINPDSLVNGKKDMKSSFIHQNGSINGSDKIGVFVANIENEEDFKELIKPYQPSSVKVVNKDLKIFAFLTVRTNELAAKIIEELNNKVQTTRKLYATYNRNNKSLEKCVEDDRQSIGSASSDFSNNSFTSKRSERYQSPVLENGQSKASSESAFAGMPKLVHESEVPDSNKFNLCWCIFISNFSPYSLESTLRSLFEKYHVMDMCIENNTSNHGPTKAILYLATVYDVIDAIREMDDCQLERHRLKVSVPFRYKIERQVVLNALEREKKMAE